MNERELVRWLADTFDASGADIGIGDDAALLDVGGDHPLALTIDTIQEGRHFERDTAAFDEMGHKAASVSLSDLAAMAARPQSLLVSAGFEQDLPDASRKALFDGIGSACDPFDCSVVGGDLYETEDHLTVTTVAVGPCPHGPVRRNGLSDGDVLFVTGSLGGSLSGRHLTFTPRVNESLWLAEHGFPTAMMDISDGLVVDLDRLLEASNQTGAVLDEERIPVHADAERPEAGDDRTPMEHALYDGEDFELLLGVPPERMDELEHVSRSDFSFIRIGRVDSSRNGIQLAHPDGEETELDPEGYLHF